MTPKKQKPITASFTKFKVTKGAVCYTEDAKDGEHKIGRLYLRKSALNGNVPEKLTVTVKV